MARAKLSEFRAKNLLYAALGQDYQGVELDSEADWQAAIDNLADNAYVIKVDQAEKGRFKKGLVKLDRSKTEVVADTKDYFKQGYRYLLVEPYQKHDQNSESYFAAELTRDGNRLSFSRAGGVDVEEQAGSMANTIYGDGPNPGIEVPPEPLKKLMTTFDANYFSFLEINPLIIDGDKLHILDAAVEADAVADFFADGWNASDLRQPRTQLSQEELAVQALAQKSQASFSLELINPNGGIWLLLSGGGASVVVADEVFNLGHGDQLANYGEYSGNPNREETRIYTDNLLKLLLKSQAADKVLVIGGGVANFTDVRATFKGVVEALQAHQDELKKQGVKVYVRRGGPHEKEGLAAMRDYLDQAGLLGFVSGPEMVLSDIVGRAVGKGGEHA